MVVYRHALLVLGLLAFIAKQLPSTMADCPLDLSGSNFTLAAAMCSDKDKRGQCCRYINAFVAVSIARYANATSNLGVASNVSDICLRSISQTMQLYGVPSNATVFCGFGTKVLVNYECKGRTTVTQMLESPKYESVAQNCRLPLSLKSDCKRCLNAGIIYLHHLVGTDNNVTLSTCRDATFTALASQFDDALAVEIASCFFGVQGLNIPSEPPPSADTPEAPPTPLTAAGPSQVMLGLPLKATHRPYHLTLVPIVGIAITAVAFVMLIVLIVLIRRKSRELDESENIDKTFSRAIPPPRPTRKFQEGPASMLRKFSYKETMKATDNFNTIIGQGGFGTVFKAEFSGGLVAAVKRMNKVSEQAEEEFCREIELLARLHHRHLVALRGFCIKKNERFLMYEYMANGSLKDHLHCTPWKSLSWQTRMQIAIDVANALEYLHFYCDPPLCHRDIKSSNILLDENFVAKILALPMLQRTVSICFEPVNTDIRGTPGYMDPEYVVTQELTEKSDIYSYGVVLLEIVTARRAIQESRNLVEWSQIFMASDSRLPELVDPRIRDSFDMDQLQTIVNYC
ncbi:receptor protein [Salix suchowensis]|nr:receptor protein [Salix suchowensis]